MTNRGGVPLLRFPVFAGYPVKAAFSTRRGGISVGPYGTLNLGLHVGDDDFRVLENRRRFCEVLGVDPARIVCGEQVHGTAAAVVGRGEIGRGALNAAAALPATDALITAVPGVSLAAFFADCVPLLFYDPQRHVAALAHAGWRGTVWGVAGETVRVMRRRFGVDPADIRAAVGPCIGPCCFRVGPEVAAKFAGVFGAHSGVAAQRDNGAWYVDLPRANRWALIAAGLRLEHIEITGVCTACQSADYFSYRGAGGQTGRMAALMMLEVG